MGRDHDSVSRFDGCCPGGWHLVRNNTLTVNNGCQTGCTAAECGFDGCLIKKCLLYTSAVTEVNFIVHFKDRTEQDSLEKNPKVAAFALNVS